VFCVYVIITASVKCKKTGAIRTEAPYSNFST
jgi:hypothetical protein